jgi:hypothetical protein
MHRILYFLKYLRAMILNVILTIVAVVLFVSFDIGGIYPVADDTVKALRAQILQQQLPEYRVARINVWHGKLLDAVQIVFKDREGNTVRSPKHGGPGGRQDVFDIDADNGEILTGIFGFAGSVVDSIGFTTNRGRTVGPWGASGDSRRNYQFTAPEIVGFYGLSGPDRDEADRVLIKQIGIKWRG